MLWLLLFISVQADSVQADISGTWKIREPAVFETAFETCHLRNVVAHVTQLGDAVTGSYEALVSCFDPNWPDHEWRRRVGTLSGTVQGEEFSLTIDDALLVLSGTTDGTVMSGTVETGDASPDWAWSAGRVRH